MDNGTTEWVCVCEGGVGKEMEEEHGGDGGNGVWASFIIIS